MQLQKYICILCTLFLCLLFSSCRSIKNVPEGDYLLVKNKISCDNKNIPISDLQLTLSQKPNKRILGIVPFNLYVYNFMKSGKERKWKNKLANSIGEEPVIFDQSGLERSIENINTYMATQSYYRSKVEVKENFKRKKKVKLEYKITAGPSYKIANIDYDISNREIAEMFFNDTVNSLIHVGSSFNTDTLKAERERITRHFKLNGYYYFSVNNVHFFADTLQSNNTANITLVIQQLSEDTDDAFKKQTIRNVNVYTNYDLKRQNTDTLGKNTNMFTKDSIRFTFDEKLTHKTSVFLQSCFLKPGDIYSIKNVEATYQHLTSLKQFRLINIKLQPPSIEEIFTNEPNKRFLDANIYLAPMKRQSFSVELESSNTSGNIGMAGVLSYRNRNIFRGAQFFSAKANVSFQTSALLDTATNEDVKSNFFNTLEYGGEIKITFPRLLFPFFDNAEFVKQHDPKTELSLSYNYQNRPDYTRTIVNLNFGYNWQGKNKHFTHYINPLELYWVSIGNFSDDFSRRIQNLYIKYSYENQFLMVCSYDFVYNNQNVNAKQDFSYLWFNIESCGNLLQGIYSLSNAVPDEEGRHNLLGVEYAQYVKTDIDYRYYDIINKKNSLVYRAFFGLGLAYGNSKLGMPFVKRYYIGGANDIRAWQVRTLGPGSYSNVHRNYDQIADMKLMLNLEYRFTMISFLHGALFLDAGNIWAIDKNDNRSGALFKFGEFYKQIALGTGFGLRFDFQFLILRFDIGIPIYNPSIYEKSKWFESFTPFNINKFTLNFGIGYPF